VERSLRLPVYEVARVLGLRSGIRRTGECRWSATGAFLEACVACQVDTVSDPASFTLTYVTSLSIDPIEIRGALLWTPAGTGLRGWFGCPRCGRRCALLHLPVGAAYFACRLCHGLRYLSQRQTRADRLERRSRKFYLRAGSLSLGAEFTVRPRGMHWRTFNRLMDSAEVLSYQACTAAPSYRALAKLLARKQLRR
jgi:hypothetical protein